MRSEIETKTMKALLQRSFLLLLLLSTACISPPEDFSQETAFLDSIKGKPFEQGVAISPIRQSYKVYEFPAVGKNTNEYEDSSSCYPSLTPEEQVLLETQIGQAVELLFGDKVAKLGSAAEDESESPQERTKRYCREAETLNSQMFMDLELKVNRVTAKGPIFGWSLGEFIGFCFYPFHVLVPNERFEVYKELVVRIYDARKPTKPIYETVITGSDSRRFNELEHGMNLLNTPRYYSNYLLGVPSQSTAGGRYDGDQWQKVYDSLSPHADRALQKNLISTLNQSLRETLKNPKIKRELEFGDPDNAMTFTFCVGQDQPNTKDREDGTRYAVKDAENVHGQLLKTAGPQQNFLFRGPVKKSKLVTALTNLRTKSVDRVLFYFSGQGVHKKGWGEGLLLENRDVLWLKELEEIFLKVPAQNVVFLFDTSFGGSSYRALKRGRRTGPRSEKLDPENEAEYLAPIFDTNRGWQVICSASCDEATGEYRSQGLFTGLFLEKLKSSSTLDLSTLGDDLTALVSSRSEALFGRAHKPFRAPASGRREFLLRRSELKPKSEKKTPVKVNTKAAKGQDKKGDS
ncbi:MAG: caspase family protein [Planctomycetota bacterium]|nr:caspase family protein [Planctomycetota bacterium]